MYGTRTHDSFQTFDAELVFERDGQTVERAYDFAVCAEVVIYLFCTGQGAVDEYFREAVCLVRT